MLSETINKIFLGNTIGTWGTALLTLLAAIITIYIFKSIVLTKLKAWSKKTNTTLDDFAVKVLDSSVVPLLYVTAVYVCSNLLVFNARVTRVIHVCFLILVTLFTARILTALVKHMVGSFIKRQDNSETKEKQAKGLLIVFSCAIWVVCALFLLDNLGFNVTTLVAGLGIGGIAIALAAQTILGDLFSYFVIFFDRPFEIGDFIIVDDKMGVVEYIGIKTTRLRTLGGEQLICSNTDLTNARVHNYKRMTERRVVFKLGVIYQTTHEKLKEIPAIVRSIVESDTTVRFDRGHFSGFGDFSLDFEFVYYVLSPDYNTFMDVQQGIYLQIVKEFEAHGIEFAYPTQSLFLSDIAAEAN